MLSIRSAGPAVVAPPPATGSSAPAQAGPRRPNLPFICTDFLQLVRNGVVIDGGMRDAMLSLITTLDDWPPGVQLRLHANHCAMERCFGPGSDQVAPVHLKQFPNGRYAAAHCGDAAPERWTWMDCGADADSLFEAVLLGLQLQNPGQHEALTHALRQGAIERQTDVQWLRQRLIDQVERGDSASVKAVATFRAAVHQQPQYREIDAWMLKDICGLGKDGIIAMGGLRGLAGQYRVSREWLGKLVNISKGHPTAEGEQLIRKREDPTFEILHITSTLLRLVDTMVKQGGLDRYGGPRAVAKHYHVSYRSLFRHIDPKSGLNDAGRKFLANETTPRRIANEASAAKWLSIPMPLLHQPSGTSDMSGLPVDPMPVSYEDLMEIPTRDLLGSSVEQESAPAPAKRPRLGI